MSSKIIIVFLFFLFQGCNSPNPFDIDDLFKCPEIYSESYLIKNGGLLFPEDVKIYGKKTQGYSQFYQIDDASKQTIMYGFEVTGRYNIDNLFRELNSVGIDTIEINSQSGRKRIVFENCDGCIFTCSVISMERLQAVTSNSMTD